MAICTYILKGNLSRDIIKELKTREFLLICLSIFFQPQKKNSKILIFSFLIQRIIKEDSARVLNMIGCMSSMRNSIMRLRKETNTI